ncbi:Translation machinery-associated protein 20 [Diplonema papillatum]|nr:Translation machinery-associated protein 20 [Diplonema papillatum]
MWKKPLGKYQTQPLKGKDVKNLKKLVGAENLSDGDEKVEVWKIEPFLHVYAVGGVPMFVDTTGKLKEKPIPTIFALWRYEDLRGAINTMHTISDVSTFVLKGADFMWPGVIESTFKASDKNELVAIAVRGNPYPFAIGRATMDTISMRLQPEKGKAVAVLQYYGDCLTQAAPARMPIPEGFSKGRVSTVAKTGPPAEQAVSDAEPEENEEAEGNGENEEVEEAEEAEETEEADEDEDSAAAAPANFDEFIDLDDDEVIPEASQGGAAAPERHLDPADAQSNDDSAGSDSGSPSPQKSKRQQRMEALASKKKGKTDKAAKKSGKPPAETPGGDAEAGEGSPDPSPEEMDDLLRVSFVTALSRLSKADLPLLVSNFYSQHLLPARPSGSVINLKKSGYKKITNLVLEMERAGVVKTKQKSPGVDQIADIDKKSKRYAELMKGGGGRVTLQAGSEGSKPAAAKEGEELDLSVLPLGRIKRVAQTHRVKGDSRLLPTVFAGVDHKTEQFSTSDLTKRLVEWLRAEAVPSRDGAKGVKGHAPDPLFEVPPALNSLWPAHKEVTRELQLTKLSANAPLGFKTDGNLVVTHVDADGIARAAQIRVGDRILKVEGQPVKDMPGLAAVLKQHPKKAVFTVKGKDVRPKEAALSDLQRRLLAYETVPAHAVHYAGAPGVEPSVVAKKGPAPQVTIVVKPRGGNSFVSYLGNLDKFGFDPAATATYLQHYLAGSVSVVTPPVAPASSTLLLQGRQFKKLAPFFDAYGLPRDTIVVSDKQAKKK